VGIRAISSQHTLPHLLSSGSELCNKAGQILSTKSIQFVVIPTEDAYEPELFVGPEHFKGLVEIQTFACRPEDEAGAIHADL